MTAPTRWPAGLLGRVRPALPYYASFAALPLLGLLQTRVLTALLSPSAYGSLQLALPIVSWCIIVGGLGAPQFLVRFYNRYGPPVFWEALSTGLVATALLATGLALLAAFVDPGVPELRRGPLLAVLLAVALFTGQVGALVKALLRVQERHLRYNAVLVLERLLILVGVASCVWLWSARPIEAFLLGSALGSVAVLLPLAARRLGNWPRILRPPSPGRTREILAFGGPIVAVMVLGEVYGTLGRYVIGFAGLGTEAVARYVIGYTIATLGLQAIYEPLVIYVQPRVFRAWERSGRAEAQAFLRRCIGLYVVAGILTCAVFLVAEPWLVQAVANSTYLLGPQVFGLLLGTSFVLGLYRFLSTQYLLSQRTGELALSYLGAVVLNLLVAVLLARAHGLLGVAAASLVSAVCLCALLWWRGRTLTGDASLAEVDLSEQPA